MALRAGRSLVTIVDQHNTVIGRRQRDDTIIVDYLLRPTKKSVFECIQLAHLINNGLHTMYIVFRQ